MIRRHWRWRYSRLPPKMERKNWKTLRMSRKIDAARSGALAMSFVVLSRWKSTIVKPAKITSPAIAKMRDPLGIRTKIAMIPNTIRTIRAQKHRRESAERSRRVASRRSSRSGAPSAS